jgi:serine/threonine-protein kinase RsbW/stage II sporulation protein AB (anti-sigma F factor)
VPDLSAVRESFSESCRATPGAVRRIRNAVTDYASAAGIVGPRLEDVRLAVSEAVTNVVMHAYRAEPGPVHVVARLVDQELWVLVADEGVGNNVPTQRPGLGLGLALMTKMCDEFTLIDRADGGTEARMRFVIPAPPPITREDQ